MSTELRDWQDKTTFFCSYSMLLICSIKLIKKERQSTTEYFWYILRFVTSFKGAKDIMWHLICILESFETLFIVKSLHCISQSKHTFLPDNQVSLPGLEGHFFYWGILCMFSNLNVPTVTSSPRQWKSGNQDDDVSKFIRQRNVQWNF